MKSLSIAMLVSLSIGVAAPVAARPRVPAAAWPVLNASHVVGMSTPSQAGAWCYNVLSREWQFYENNEHLSYGENSGDLKLHPVPVYDKTVTPEGCGNVLIVTLWGTVDVQNTTMLLRCRVNDVPCNVLGQASSAPSGELGWVAVRTDDGDDEEITAISRSWCIDFTQAAISGSAHVTIDMENKDDGDGAEISIETADFEIDEAFIGDPASACVEGSNDGNDTDNEDPPRGILPPLPRLPGVSPAPTPPRLPPVPSLPRLP